MATNRIKVKRDGDKVIVTSNDPHIKQAFFSWGSWGTGSGKREYPEFYGRSIEKDPRVRPDNEMHQWDLTDELVRHLFQSMLSLSERHSESKFEAETRDEIFESTAEMKATSDVMRALSVIIRGETPEELSPFVEAYITAALWSTNDNSAEEDGRDGEFLDDNFGVGDIAPEAMEKIKADCNAFLEKAEKFLEEAGVDAEQAGHDFWLTREGHGVGFWDRGLGELGRTLTEIAKSFGETYIEVGDDGQLHGF